MASFTYVIKGRTYSDSCLDSIKAVWFWSLKGWVEDFKEATIFNDRDDALDEVRNAFAAYDGDIAIKVQPLAPVGMKPEPLPKGIW